MSNSWSWDSWKVWSEPWQGWWSNQWQWWSQQWQGWSESQWTPAGQEAGGTASASAAGEAGRTVADSAAGWAWDTVSASAAGGAGDTVAASAAGGDADASPWKNYDRQVISKISQDMAAKSGIPVTAEWWESLGIETEFSVKNGEEHGKQIL